MFRARWGLLTLFVIAAIGCRQQKGNKFVPLVNARGALGQTAEKSGNPLEPQVKELFTQKCYGCHGENGSNAGNIGDIRNLSALRDKKLVLIGKPEESKIYSRLINKEQPMPPPPAAMLAQDEIELVKSWILENPNSRFKVSYESVYETIEKDFNALNEEDKVNTRYFHLVNNYNAGVPDDGLEQVRKGLSKMLNMLSTSDKIHKPVALDDKQLVYRVNLKLYELDRPETMYTHMLKSVYPTFKDDLERVTKWFPDPEERQVENYYGARYKEIVEGKGTESKFVVPGEHTFEAGLPVANHPILKRMAQAMREAPQKSDEPSKVQFGYISAQEKADSKRCREEANPTGIKCSSPLPLVRAEWFIAQFSGNMRMRLYYHGSGMDDDTVTLDAALGIDDVEGSMYDNDPDFDPAALPKEKRIIRAGFNNSGVSINHRTFERISLDYLPGKPLWRAFEFKDKNKEGFKQHDLFRYAAGPIFEIANEDEAGFECINLMSPRFTYLDGFNSPPVRTLSLLDNGLLYPSVMPNNKVPTVVTKLRDPTVTGAERTTLLGEFEATYGHQDFERWRSYDYIAQYGALPVKADGIFAGKNMIQCELDRPIAQWQEGFKNNPIPYRHETLEYLFLKRNGMQAFVNVGLKAEHIDYKVPNQRALENKAAVLIPAHDRPELFVVGAPLSCLSCHVQGYIEKEDQVREYINKANRPEGVGEQFWNLLKQKINRFNVPFDELKAQMEIDNGVFRKALSDSGINYKDPEPIVDTYRAWAITGMTFAHVAEELELTEAELTKRIKFNSKVANYLNEFAIEGATMKRSEFEKAYRPLMCEIHQSCKTTDPKNIIPNQ